MVVMMEPAILPVKDRQAFREWLAANHDSASECWIVLKRGRPDGSDTFWYLDAVEEAICFGWIDSSLSIVDGVRAQRFSPRRKGSNWTELNKERVRRLEKLGLMTDAGRRVLPPMGPRSFRMDGEIEAVLRQRRIWGRFMAFPPLYRRVRTYNLVFTRTHSPASYPKALEHFLEETAAGRMYGQWDDYGRLTDY